MRTRLAALVAHTKPFKRMRRTQIGGGSDGRFSIPRYCPKDVTRRFILIVLVCGGAVAGLPSAAYGASPWRIVTSPSGGQLTAVAAVSANNVWAVGGTGSQPLIGHW